MKLLHIKFLPLSIVIGFNLFTLLVFFTAPFRWVTDNLFLFFMYAMFNQCMIIVGFNAGYKKSLRMPAIKGALYRLSPWLLNFIFVFYSATFLIKYAYRLKYAVYDIKGMASTLIVGITDPQLGYALSLDETRAYTISWSIYFCIAIIDLIFFIIGFIKWKELGKLKKMLFVFFVLLEVFYWMGRGTNFGVISLITTMALTLLFKLKAKKINFGKFFKLAAIVLALSFVGLYVFSHNMYNRAGRQEIDVHYFDFGFSEVDKSSPAFDIIPKSFQQTYLYVVSYLGQGYYHTCLAFDLDFENTYLLGSNTVSIEWAKLLGVDVWKNTYMYRLQEKGIDPLIKWHSAYLWYASAVTFWGVPFLLGFLGYMFGFSWGYSLWKDDFLSKIIFIILGNMLFYLFANNSYLSSVFYSLIFILPYWYFTRIKRLAVR